MNLLWDMCMQVYAPNQKLKAQDSIVSLFLISRISLKIVMWNSQPIKLNLCFMKARLR